MKRSSLDRLKSQLEEMRRAIETFEALDESVSSAPVGWHIEHCLLILNGVISTLKASDPKAYKRKINLTKLYIFARGKFPRGKAKSPKSVRPTVDFDQTSLNQHLLSVEKKLPSLNDLDSKAHFKHPFFGNLRLSESIYFLDLHTEHHLKIIREILS